MSKIKIAGLVPLGFCLLASLWLNLPFMPSDFARWAMNGSLPTYSCHTLLPLRSYYRALFEVTVCANTQHATKKSSSSRLDNQKHSA